MTHSAVLDERFILLGTPSLAELSHAAVLTTSGLRQALAHLGPGAFPNADFPTCWFSASVPLPENWGPENSLP